MQHVKRDWFCTATITIGYSLDRMRAAQLCCLSALRKSMVPDHLMTHNVEHYEMDNDVIGKRDVFISNGCQVSVR